MLPKGCTLVVNAEEPSPLQLWYEFQGDIIKTLRKIGKHHGEPVTAPLRKPSLHLVGNHLRCPNECQAGIATIALCELTNRQVLFLRQPHRLRSARFAGIGFRNVWKRPLGIEA